MSVEEAVQQKLAGNITSTALNRILKPHKLRWCPGVPKLGIAGHAAEIVGSSTCRACTYAHVMGKPRHEHAPEGYILVGTWAREKGFDYANMNSDSIQHMRKRIDPRPVRILGWWYAHKDAQYVPPMRDIVQGWKRAFDAAHAKDGLMWCSAGVHQKGSMGHAAISKGNHKGYMCIHCVRDARYRRVYGITLEQVREMLRQQVGACALCSCPLDEDTLNVDHCHQTGRIRGLLCSRCNLHLGVFEQNFSLEKIRAYL